MNETYKDRIRILDEYEAAMLNADTSLNGFQQRFWMEKALEAKAKLMTEKPE